MSEKLKTATESAETAEELKELFTEEELQAITFVLLLLADDDVANTGTLVLVTQSPCCKTPSLYEDIRCRILKDCGHAEETDEITFPAGFTDRVVSFEMMAAILAELGLIPPQLSDTLATAIAKARQRFLSDKIEQAGFQLSAD